jgi:PEP-CTERM motif
LAVGGAATLSGTLDVDLLNGFQVADGETFNIMSFASSIGDFTNFELNGSDCTAGGADIYNCSGLPSGLFFEEQFVNNDTGLDLVVGETGGGGGTPVPEPWTIALFAAGLAGLTAMRRRFKAKTS